MVKKYNEFMGGVDLMDSLISLYKIHIRSHQFYHKIIYHMIFRCNSGEQLALI